MVKKFYKEDNEPIPDIKFLEEGTQPAGFTEITDIDEIKSQYKKIYHERAKHGLELYNDIRVDLATEFNTGEMTEADAYFIEKKLIDAKSFLLTGNWVMARHELDQLTIEGAYTQGIHDSIKLKVDDYYVFIQENL